MKEEANQLSIGEASTKSGVNLKGIIDGDILNIVKISIESVKQKLN